MQGHRNLTSIFRRTRLGIRLCIFCIRRLRNLACQKGSTQWSRYCNKALRCLSRTPSSRCSQSPCHTSSSPASRRSALHYQSLSSNRGSRSHSRSHFRPACSSNSDNWHRRIHCRNSNCHRTALACLMGTSGTHYSRSKACQKGSTLRSCRCNTPYHCLSRMPAMFRRTVLPCHIPSQRSSILQSCCSSMGCCLGSIYQSRCRN